MKKLAMGSGQWAVSGLVTMLFLSGCTVRTYSAVKDRVDQETGGNQGYLTGSAPAGAPAPKKFIQRTTRIVEIEMHSPVKFEKVKEPPKPIERRETQDISPEGKRGYLEVPPPAFEPNEDKSTQRTAAEKYDTYIVKKDDSLQKISVQSYGTSKKWTKIFEANKDELKSPDKIRAGQQLKIPRD